eukprot:GHVH01000216.1.p1 GENE.GHVH01000216.1~~GHVH01000216.1.p1  ORF type:complete len:1051 (+),score=138.13 GHVH01000216.1:271-3423(+)
MNAVPLPWKASPSAVCSAYGVDPSVGLNSNSVHEHRRRFGRNLLESKPSKSLFACIMEQFDDYLVRILLFSALISFVLAVLGGSFETDGLAALVEPVVIMVILVVNAVIAIAQDNDSEKALLELTRLQPVLAKVKRDNLLLEINAEDIVPGDIIEIRVGDKVPADARVIEIMSMSLKVEQSGLTGENEAVEKIDDEISVHSSDAIADQCNMLFSATTVVVGHAKAVVVATGMRTQIGAIQSAVMDADDEQTKTPLGMKIDQFGEQLANVIAVICVIVWIINYKHFTDPEHGGWVSGCIYYFKIAISLAVAAIPEGLPAVITTCLALGTRKMTARNAIVRHLPSVETLGCTTVICSDKTGTLTTNEMVVNTIVTFGARDELVYYHIDGTSFTPKGNVYMVDSYRTRTTGESESPIRAEQVSLGWLARICSINNNSSLEADYSNLDQVRFVARGEPTEAALKVLVEKLGCPDQALNRVGFQKARCATRGSSNCLLFCNYWSSGWDKLLTIEFDRHRKSMSEYIRNKSTGEEFLIVKGAPEGIIKRSSHIMLSNGTVVPFSPASRQKLTQSVIDLASRGLRTLMFGMKSDVNELRGINKTNRRGYNVDVNLVENDLTIVGLVGMLDPPRDCVKGAIQKCKDAGILVHMITGDNRLTAETIGKEIGIIGAHSANTASNSFTGSEFDAMTKLEQLHVLKTQHGLILSRMEPRHKQTIIKRLKELGHVIAMTGDGVNDAPALKSADIGIAMGISGSAVAKEASDMILADDNFDTIVAAVEEGRSIYNNMKAFIRYLISSNIGEVASIFITAALGIPEGLTPVQLLWVNLVTDGPPATALGFNPPDLDVMNKRPRSKDEPLISGWVFFRYCSVGLYVGIATVVAFIWWFVFDTNGGHSTVTLTELMHWDQCSSWSGFKPEFDGIIHNDPCSIFHQGKLTASTMSLSVLVLIEMLNALNAISEDYSLISLPPWHNVWLMAAIATSLVLHAMILYVPWLATLFGVVPIGLREWSVVFLLSVPVIIIEEILKFAARQGGLSRTFTLPGSAFARDIELKEV